MLVVRIPPAGVAPFQQYEALVLPLLAGHGARLERRLRNHDATVEIHELWFPSAAHFDAYRSDPARQQFQPLLESSGAVSELFEVTPIDE